MRSAASRLCQREFPQEGSLDGNRRSPEAKALGEKLLEIRVGLGLSPNGLIRQTGF
jgi:hypothetical protein